MKVKVYDKYRFAIPVIGRIIKKSASSDSVEVRLETTNNGKFPVGSTIWVHAGQCRAILKETKANA